MSIISATLRLQRKVNKKGQEDDWANGKITGGMPVSRQEEE